jgi:hypothetical protein
MLLAVPALALLSAPVLAKPEVPFKPEVQMHVSSDGRADLHVDHSSRVDPYAVSVEKPAADSRYGRESHFQAPIKADVAIKMQNGDNREGSSAKTAAAAHPAEQNAAAANSKFVPPLKTSVALRLQNGDSRDSNGASTKATGAKGGADRAERKGISKHQKELLCQQTGVCLPSPEGSDDTEDKTE